MSFALFIQDEAGNEIREAYNWYLEKSVAAASNFEKEITHAFSVLAKGQMEYREVITGVRVLSLTVFPYNIYYRRLEKGRSMQVIAVLHNKRNPDFVLRRVKND